MATALSVPEGVSETLIAQLSDIQNQIKVLIGNHKILSARLSHNPQDDLIPRQLKTVESFLCQFNEKQKPILAEIREEIRQLRAGEEVASVISETIDGDEEETKLEADAKSKTSFVDRMAQVREKKRRKRRGGRPPATGSSSKRTTPSPTWDESKDSFVLDEDSIGAGSDRFRGHVEEVEKFSVNIADLKKCEEVPEPVQRTEIFSTNEDPLKFMRNLDLITSGDLRDLEEHYEKVKKERREFRNLTYIPEFTEQKKKLPSYNWLSAEASSPPLLRTRRHKRRQLLDQSAAAKASQAAETVAGTATAASTAAAAASERKTRSRRRKDSTSDSTASTPMPMDEDEGEGEEEEYDEEESRQ